jgi:hypothetical protein
MPAFKSQLSDTQLWQVSELVAHANEIPDFVKKILASDLSTLPVTLPRSASAHIRLLSKAVRRQKS